MSRYGQGDPRVSSAKRRGLTAAVATSETTTSTSYTDLATTGPAVTMPEGGDQLLLYRCGTLNNNTAGSDVFYSPAVAGATAVDADAVGMRQFDAAPRALYGASGMTLAAGVAAGSTHTMKYKVAANTGTYADRRLAVVLV